jgi:uncharacterized protein DUF3631
VTPRLALISPVRNCGKTTLLDVVSRMVARPQKTDHTTAAWIFHSIERLRGTQLIDEADNLEVSTTAVLRSVLNSGHRAGGTITRLYRGEPKSFLTFAPVAFASIGALTLPLMSRSIAVHMERHDEATKLRRFDKMDTADLDTAYREILLWARAVELNLDPDLPDVLRGRAADNWRPLISIADTFGPAWSARAREAAIEFSRGRHDEDVGVELLTDIRNVFDERAVDRIASADLVAALLDIEEAPWSEFRGPLGTQQPRRLSTAMLAALLRPFGIGPRTIWPARRDASSRSRKGYFRTQFERGWAAYCGIAAGGHFWGLAGHSRKLPHPLLRTAVLSVLRGNH